MRARHLDRAVGRSVVDDEPLDRVDAGDLTGEVAERPRELLFLVLAGDLDDQFQSARIVSGVLEHLADVALPHTPRLKRMSAFTTGRGT
jgi:hypothetical protein